MFRLRLRAIFSPFINFMLFIPRVIYNKFTTLNQQNAQTWSLDIYIITSHIMCLHVLVCKGPSSGNKMEVIQHTTKSVSFVYSWYGVELVRKLVAHGDTREGKWRGNWRMEWVASTLTPAPNMVYPALFKLMRTPQLPAVDWTDAPTDLNGLVRFGERRNLVSARMPSRSARAILKSNG